MSKLNYDFAKYAFYNQLLKLALQKINYIPVSPLTVLVNYVSNEYIKKYTFFQFSSNFHIKVSNIELNKHIIKHSQKILANDYDCSGFLQINNYYIHLDHFSKAFSDLYFIATSIDLSSIDSSSIDLSSIQS